MRRTSILTSCLFLLTALAGLTARSQTHAYVEVVLTRVGGLAPISGATVYLVPVAYIYPNNRVELTAHTVRVGTYYANAVEAGVYDVWVNQAKYNPPGASVVDGYVKWRDSLTVPGTSVEVTYNRVGLDGDGVTTELNPDSTLSVKDGGIDTDQLADDAVTAAKLADAAVTAEKLGADVIATIDSLRASRDSLNNGTGIINVDSAYFNGGINLDTTGASAKVRLVMPPNTLADGINITMADTHAVGTALGYGIHIDQTSTSTGTNMGIGVSGDGVGILVANKKGGKGINIHNQSGTTGANAVGLDITNESPDAPAMRLGKTAASPPALLYVNTTPAVGGTAVAFFRNGTPWFTITDDGAFAFSLLGSPTVGFDITDNGTSAFPMLWQDRSGNYRLHWTTAGHLRLGGTTIGSDDGNTVQFVGTVSAAGLPDSTTALSMASGTIYKGTDAAGAPVLRIKP